MIDDKNCFSPSASVSLCNAHDVLQYWNVLSGEEILKNSWTLIKKNKMLNEDSMLLSCQVRVLEWIYTLSLHESQGTSFSKQARYLKFYVTATGFERTIT